MVRWRQLDGTSTISSGPVRQGVALFALEEEDAKMGRIPIRKVGQRASGLSSHILCSALVSSSWSAGVVAGVADLEDDAMMEGACRITSSIGLLPSPNNNDNMRQLVLLRTNGIVRPNLPPPASSSPPLLSPQQQQ